MNTIDWKRSEYFWINHESLTFGEKILLLFESFICEFENWIDQYFVPIKYEQKAHSYNE